jgi:hypothetical protein
MSGLKSTLLECGRALPPLPADVAIEVQRILDGIAKNTSAFMTGSIVEGFGNAHSDVDLYVVQDEGRPEQAIAIGMRQSRYVDCEYFAASGLMRLSRRMGSASWGDLETLRLAEIDRYYRLAASVPLRITSDFAPVFATFNKQVGREMFGKSALLRACELFGCASLLAATGDSRGAELTLRTASVWIATAELAQEGEGYPSAKWLGEKAARRYGRGSPKFERVLAEYLRPSGDLAPRIDRLRERLIAPVGLTELLDARTCALADGVRAVRNGSDWLFINETLGVATIGGAVGAAVASLTEGTTWLQATEELSRSTGVRCGEVRAGMWHESAKLRITGHLVEKRRSNG